MQTLSFLGLTVYPYGLCLAVATLAALALMGVMGWRRGLPAGTVRVFGVLAIPLGILFARALYCAVNVKYFVHTCERPLLMLNFFDGGLSMYGMLLGLVLAALIASRLMKARFATLLDVLAAPTALLIAVERWAERYTELGVGKVIEKGALTDALPWLFLSERAGKNVEYRLAAYNFEALTALIIFAVILVLLFAKGQKLCPGDLALLFFALFGATQVILESIRDDGHMRIVFLRVGQLIAAFMPVIASAALLSRQRRVRGRAGSRRTALSRVVLALCIAMLVFLEFSLDGRITIGNASMGRDYGLMFLTCAALFAVPCSLIVTFNKRAYHDRGMAVHAPIR